MLAATTSRKGAGRDVMPSQRLLARSPAVLAPRARHRSLSECELQLAQAMQMSMVSQTLTPWSEYSFGACMEPAHVVGGDFFDIIPLTSYQLGIVVGDVAGSGVPAARMMMRVATLLRVETRRGAAPAAALHRLNQHLVENNDTGLFVTIVYGVLDRRTGVFSYARAGHEYPVVVTAGGDVQLPSPGVGQPLGVLDDPLLDEQVIPLRPDATLLLYTDGIAEAMDQRRQMFGLERMVTVAQAQTHRAPQAVCDALWHTVHAFRSPEAAHDDMTIVAVRAGADPYTVAFGNVRLLLAHLYHCQGRTEEALAELTPVLAERAQQNTPGLIMWEAAPVVIPLLQLAVQQRVHAPFAAHVIQLLGSHAATTSGAQPVVINETGEALTPREIDVLRLLAAGYSNRAMAERWS